MKNIIVVILIFSLFSCKENLDKNELIANPNIVQTLDSFVKYGSCDDCIYELYIDKKAPQLCELILYKGKYSLMERTGNNTVLPVTYFKTSRGIRVEVYSGSEDYFRKSNATKSNHIMKDDSVIENTDNYKIWVVQDSAGVFTTREVRFAYPFMPLPKANVSFEKH